MVDSNDLKSVAFIFEERLVDGAKRKVPIGTAFFVEIIESPDLSWYYLVAARHVIEDPESEVLHVRVNKKEDVGGITEWATAKSDWFIHEDADVAAIPFDPHERAKEGFDIIAWPLDRFVGADYRLYMPPFDKGGGLPVSVGGEVFIVSLFIQHAGRERNLPIARFGHIARMPARVTIKRWRGSTPVEVVAYLVECHSWGGHSGAPVVWLHPVTRSAPGGYILGHVRALLGLVSAHWNIPVKAQTKGDILGRIETDVNAGIAIVTPAEAIRQLLTRADMVKDRDARRKRLESDEPTPKLDRASDDEFSKEEFEATLRQVSQKVKPTQPDESSSETWAARLGDGCTGKRTR